MAGEIEQGTAAPAPAILSGRALDFIRPGLHRIPSIVVLGGIAAVLLLARRPESFLAPEFVWEEGAAFYAPTYFTDPLTLLAHPWAGYLNLVPRLGYLLVALAPVVIAPLIDNLLGIVIEVAVIGFIASERMSGLIPSRPMRWLIAGVLVFLPAQRDMLGSLLNAHSYLSLYLIALSLSAEPRGIQRFLDLVCAGTATLSGPFGALLWPLFLWRGLRNRTWASIALCGVVGACGLLQALVVVNSHRLTPGGVPDLITAIRALGYRLIVVPTAGERFSGLLGSIGIPLWLGIVVAFALGIGLATLCVRTLPSRVVITGAYAILAIVGSGLILTNGFQNLLADPTASERYFFLPTVLVATTIVLGVRKRVAFSYPLALLLAVGVIADLRLDPYPTQGWAQNYACIGSPRPCTVPIYPSYWSIHWPGTGGRYVLQGGGLPMVAE